MRRSIPGRELVSSTELYTIVYNCIKLNSYINTCTELYTRLKPEKKYGILYRVVLSLPTHYNNYKNKVYYSSQMEYGIFQR